MIVIRQHLSMVVPPTPTGTRASEFVQDLKAVFLTGQVLSQNTLLSKVLWEGISHRLHQVFEHQLDKEVPAADGYDHSDPVRC